MRLNFVLSDCRTEYFFPFRYEPEVGESQRFRNLERGYENAEYSAEAGYLDQWEASYRAKNLRGEVHDVCSTLKTDMNQEGATYSKTALTLLVES